MGKIDLKLVRTIVTAVAAADAIGASTEFDSHIAAIATWGWKRGFGFPFRPVGGGPFNLPAGAHTDDTAMVLCIVRSFIEHNGNFEIEDIASRWVRWMESGPPDIGNTTRAALTRIANGMPTFDAGFKTFSANSELSSNGSLMRNGVIAALAAGTTLETAFEWSTLASIVTHYHPLCVLCCAVQTWLMWEILQKRWPFDRYDDWLEAWHTSFVEWIVRCSHPQVRQWRKRVERGGGLSMAMDALVTADFDPDSFSPLSEPMKGREGDVLLTLQVAIFLLRWSLRRASKHKLTLPGTYQALAKVFQRRGSWVLGWCGALGHDADTYGATAAPLIVCANGGNIPETFLDNLCVLRERWLFD